MSNEDRMSFHLYGVELERADAWIRERNLELATKQVNTLDQDDHRDRIEMIRASIEQGNPQPYMGAIGGGIAYTFIPTSLGTIVKIRYLDQEINVTDYDCW